MSEYRSEEVLRELYHEKGMSQSEIADEFDVSQATINNWIQKLDIESRSISESISGERNGFYGKTHSEEFKEKKSKQSKEWLENNEHPMKGRSHSEESIERMSENSSGEQHPFYGEERPEHSEKMSEDGNPNWMGGHRGYRGPSWTEELRERIREREGRTCPGCGTREEELERKLDVHHIIPFIYYGMDNHEEANREDNLVALCPSCHHEIDSIIMNIEKIENGEIGR